MSGGKKRIYNQVTNTMPSDRGQLSSGKGQIKGLWKPPKMLDRKNSVRSPSGKMSMKLVFLDSNFIANWILIAIGQRRKRRLPDSNRRPLG